MIVTSHYITAFTELQTDMTEMTADIQALHGLPFYEYNYYCMKVLFPSAPDVNGHPVMARIAVNTLFMYAIL